MVPPSVTSKRAPTIPAAIDIEKVCLRHFGNTDVDELRESLREGGSFLDTALPCPIARLKIA